MVALPKSIGIKLYDDSFVPVLTEGEVKNKRVVLTTVRDNQQKAIIELYEGTSDRCINNEYLGKLTIDINRDSDKGEPGLEVHLRLDDDGVLYAKAWDQESKVENEIRIEHSATRKIIPETLSDEEIDQLDGSGFQEIDGYSAGDEYNNTSYQDTVIAPMETEKEDNGNGMIILLIIAILLILLGIGGFFIYRSLTTTKKPVKQKTVIEKPVEEPVVQEPVIQEPPKEETPPAIEETKPVVEEQKPEVIGMKKLEGKRHFVRWGDNLWNICKRYYNDPWYYPDLAEQNGLKNPRLILAGTYIVIPPKSQVKRWDFSK